MDLQIFPPGEILQAAATLPPSKSIAARAMVMDAMAGGAPRPQGEEQECDDLRALRVALSAPPSGEKYADASGTAMRFLTALYAATEGADVTITGTGRLRERPIAPLVDVLRALGADIAYTQAEGQLPLRVRGRRLAARGPVEIDATVSSQFISALLMIAPAMDGGLEIKLKGEPASLPYIDLTIAMMRDRGIAAERDGHYITVHEDAYAVPDSTVEADWSAAAFWYEIAALTAATVALPGLLPDSRQGDRAAERVFERLGVRTDFLYRVADVRPAPYGAQISMEPEQQARLDLNLADTPDLVPALAVTCCLLGTPFTFTGLECLRDKECDRISALITELGKLAFALTSPAPGTLEWDGTQLPVMDLLNIGSQAKSLSAPTPQRPTARTESGPVTVDSHGDHRIAMALAPAAIYEPGLILRGAEAVSKSYPDFWRQLDAAGFTLVETQTPQP